jgi:DNA modification methylase
VSDKNWIIAGRYLDLLHGECIERMSRMDDCCVDSVITDPPYHLLSIVKRFGGKNAAPAQHGTDGAFARQSRGFMGKQWDGGDIAQSVELWKQCLRVLKPGGYLAAFSHTRTYHRMAVAIEDAGFTIRDQYAWVYGKGFPHGQNIALAIDKMHGHGNRGKRFNTATGDGAWAIGEKSKGREVYDKNDGPQGRYVPKTDEAREWDGWNTNVKPAWEPICVAQKPITEKSVAANIQRWGTGAINIDGCRVPLSDNDDIVAKNPHTKGGYGHGNANVYGISKGAPAYDLTKGRYPANFIHDGSEQVRSLFPSVKGQNKVRVINRSRNPDRSDGWGMDKSRATSGTTYADGDGSASRFFYSAKASKYDRCDSKHPTVKPIELMRWLTRHFTPPGGVVLDPFSGTGTTGFASYLEGFDAVMIEREDEYITDIIRRFRREWEQLKQKRAA